MANNVLHINKISKLILQERCNFKVTYSQLKIFKVSKRQFFVYTNFNVMGHFIPPRGHTKQGDRGTAIAPPQKKNIVVLPQKVATPACFIQEESSGGSSWVTHREVPLGRSTDDSS